MATRLPEFKISAAVRNCSTGGVGNGGLQEDDVRTLGLRIERLSAASFIICTSFETVRWATPRSESAIRQARLPDKGMLRSSNLFIVERNALHQLHGIDALLKTHATQIVESEPREGDHRSAVNRFVSVCQPLIVSRSLLSAPE